MKPNNPMNLTLDRFLPVRLLGSIAVKCELLERYELILSCEAFLGAWGVDG